MFKPARNPHNSIRNGKAVDRICIVIDISDGVVTVTYTATFKASTKLPFENKEFWYPVRPAEKEGDLEPLPAVNDKAQWVSLRRGHKVAGSKVKTLPNILFFFY